MNHDHVNVGMDIGDGNTTVHFKEAGAAQEPECLQIDGAESIVTAVGTYADGTVIIGRKPIDLYTSLTTLNINFKNVPTDGSGFASAVPVFVQTLLGAWKRSRGGAPGSTAFYVGVPSGWDQKAWERYRQILVGAGLPKVTLVKESRAAFLDSFRHEPGPVNPWSRAVVDTLVLDLGSSTMDATFIHDYRHEWSFDDSAELGGRDIDRLLLNHFLSVHPRGAEIAQLMAAHPPLEAKLLFVCRQNKEDFFTHEEIYRQCNEDGGTYVTQGPYDDICRQGILFCAEIDGPLMDRILGMPLPQHDGLSWRDAFRRKLEQIRGQLKAAPRRVIMTGGGSRMSFTADIAKEVFGLTDAAVLRDNRPEFSIGRGLALAGDLDWRVGRFRSDLRTYTDVSMPALVKEHEVRLARALSLTLTDKFLSDALTPALRAFRAGHIATCDGVDKDAKQRFSAWQLTAEYEEAVRQTVEAWFADVRLALEKRPREICREYRIPENALDLPSPFTLTLDFAPSVGYATTHIKIGSLVAGVVLGLTLATGFVALGIGAAVAALGYNFADDLERQFLTDDRVRQLVVTNRPVVLQSMETAIAACRELADLSKRLTRDAKQAFNRNADQAAALLAIPTVHATTH
jgi:hypothetical protein